MEYVAIGLIKPNPDNPRTIKDDKFRKLVQSIKDFPEMLELRPIVVNAEMIVLGGNMRLLACRSAGLKTVPVIRAEHLTLKQQREFIVKDNVGFGEWDWDALANQWDTDALKEWGLDIPSFDIVEEENVIESESPYTTKVEAPIYTPTNECPPIAATFDIVKYETLIDEINKSAISAEEKTLLRYAATRHIKFDYAKVADLYAHSLPAMQRLMEESALVIIDFDQAIELGYVKISETLLDQFEEETRDRES